MKEEKREMNGKYDSQAARTRRAATGEKPNRPYAAEVIQQLRGACGISPVRYAGIVKLGFGR